MAKNFEKYTWGKFEKDSEKIAAWAKSRNFKSIYGIPRGGLVLGVKLSHLLQIPLVLAKDDVTRDTLIVDDIVDGGGTVDRLLYGFGQKFSVTSIYFNKTGKIAPNFFVREKKEWVVFPWETEKTSKYDLITE